jgi:phenylacetic acid degradation operon negative regulatory protein
MSNPVTVADDYPGQLTARELILALIDSSSSATLSASYFIAAGALFDMDPGNLRVSLGRLVKDGSLRSVGRGLYQRASRDGALHSMVRRWAEVESTLTSWQGGWLGASVAHLSRKNRHQVKSWERAMRLCGFAPFQTGMWLRPANLLTPADELRGRLLELGFPDTGLLMDIVSITPLDTETLTALWPVQSLETGYRDNISRLTDSQALLDGLSSDAAARETLVVGRLVTRDILLDPLLPEQMIDTRLRSRMISSMQRYDQIGRAIWREFYQRHNPVEQAAAD